MDMSELIERTKQNIWQAISDYGKHTDQTSVMDDCTANFVNQLASDSCYAKQELREPVQQVPCVGRQSRRAGYQRDQNTRP